MQNQDLLKTAGRNETTRTTKIYYFIPILALIHLTIGLLRTVFPYDLDQSSINFIVNSLLLSGRNPWDLETVLSEPYCIPAYGIFYHLFAAFGQMLFGIQYFFMRLISFLSCITICFLAYNITDMTEYIDVNRINKSRQKINPFRLGSCITLVLILCSPAFISNNSIGRADNLGIAITMTGVLMLLRFDKIKSHSLVPILSGLLIGSGPLIKQSFISALVFGLVLSWKKRTLKPFALTAVGFPAVVTGIIIVISGGDFIQISLVFPSLPEKSIMNIWSVFKSTFFLSPGHLVILFGFLSILVLHAYQFLTKKQVTQSSTDLLIIWCLLAGMIATYSSSRKLGGNQLYWLEFLVLSSIVIGGYINSRNDLLFRSRRFEVAFLVLFLTVFACGLVFSARSMRGLYFEWSALPYYNELQTIVREKTPANLPVVEYYSNIGPLTSRKVLFNDLLLYHHTTNQNQELLRSAILNKIFSCLILQPQNVSDYLTDDYIEVSTKNPYPNRIFAARVYLLKDLIP